MSTITEELPGVEWIVDMSVEPPERLVKVELDLATVMSLIDIADAATFAQGARTRENAELVRSYFLRVSRELQTRSVLDHDQWAATKHLDGA
jgi:hypothetical protein